MGGKFRFFSERNNNLKMQREMRTVNMARREIGI